MHDDINERLRALVRFAQAGGAPAAWLEETSHAIVALVLDNAELRRHVNRRFAETLADATRLAAFLELCERNAMPDREAIRAARTKFGWRPGAFYRRLRLCRDSRNALALTSHCHPSRSRE